MQGITSAANKAPDANITSAGAGQVPAIAQPIPKIAAPFICFDSGLDR